MAYFKKRGIFKNILSSVLLILYFVGISSQPQLELRAYYLRELQNQRSSFKDYGTEAQSLVTCPRSQSRSFDSRLYVSSQAMLTITLKSWALPTHSKRNKILFAVIWNISYCQVPTTVLLTNLCWCEFINEFIISENSIQQIPASLTADLFIANTTTLMIEYLQMCM